MFGGLIHYYFNQSTAPKLRKPLYEEGLLLCSGMVAGDALMGVAMAVLMANGLDTVVSEKFKDYWFAQSPWFASAVFGLFCAFLIWQLRQKRAVLNQRLSEESSVQTES
jgi:hypothetical protein